MSYEKDLQQAVQDAEEWLRDCVIIDTETTGLQSAEIVQIAVIDHAGAVLLDTLVNPPHPERALIKSAKGICAVDIHGLTPDKLEGAPEWPEVYQRLVEAIRGRKVIIYNAEYDWPIIRRMCQAYDLPEPEPLTVDCAMKAYAVYIGDYSEYHGNYRYQRLPGGDHSALGDCRATLDVLKVMTGGTSWPAGIMGHS
jgi:DNA polymerase-3 subunit epsilon